MSPSAMRSPTVIPSMKSAPDSPSPFQFASRELTIDDAWDRVRRRGGHRKTEVRRNREVSEERTEKGIRRRFRNTDAYRGKGKAARASSAAEGRDRTAIRSL